MRLSSIFSTCNAVCGYGKLVRACECDGLEKWRRLEEVLVLPSASIIRWTDKSLALYNFMINELHVVEVKDSSIIIECEWERHHFFLQHGRIPHRKKDIATHVQLLQIMYNAGQMSVEHVKSPYSTEWVAFYEQNKLSSPGTYCSEEQLEEMSELCDAHQIQGKVEQITRELSTG